MYKVFASRLKSSTAFRVRPDPDKAGYYLVKHTRPPTDFPWLCHEFWVKAVVNEEIPEESEFNCECMRIEHTGMFIAEKCSFCFLVRCRKMFIRFTELLNLQVCFARIFCVCLQTCKWRISHPGISPKGIQGMPGKLPPLIDTIKYMLDRVETLKQAACWSYYLIGVHCNRSLSCPVRLEFFFDVWCCITELLSMLLTLSYINGLMISYIYYWITGRG